MSKQCHHCEEEFEADERFVEVQPAFVNQHDELHHENMAWYVHIGCVDGLLSGVFGE
jgi:hypothetical protein